VSASSGISVVIPVRDGEEFLAETLAAIVGQSLPPDEVIVVDDASSDRTAEIAESFGDPVRCLRKTTWGKAGAARNDGVAAARGELIALADGDDLPDPRWLELLRAAIEDQPPADLAVGHMRLFVSGEEFDEADPGRPGMVPPGILVRRSAFERVGPFATGYTFGEFIDWLSRARDAGIRERTIVPVVYNRRVHGGNMTIRDRDQYGDYAIVLKKALDRRRAND
jgi:glycosyltransferase involved in cell wall biosynthesis